MKVELLVTDFLRRAASLYPEKTAIVDGARRFTYRQYQQRCNRLAHALLDLGVKQGDRVAIISPNSHAFLESFYGTAMIGAVLVPVSYRLLANDHEYILGHSGALAVIADPQFLAEVDEVFPRLPELAHRIAAPPALTASGADDAAASPPAGWLDWEPLLASAPTHAPEPPEIDENDLVSINYTSGTTARPKGVMLTHRNCYVNAYNFIAHLRVAHHDVELWTLPMFHCNGWGGPYALTAMGGTHVVLRAIRGEEIYRLIADEGVTFACMAPAVLRTILDFPDKDRYRITTQPRFTVAGAPPPAAFIERLEEELGWEFLQIYGLTETAPILTVATPDAQLEKNDYPRRSRAGVPAIGVDVQVMDDTMNPVPRDDLTVGEICARANCVMEGYWEQPEATAEAFAGGYFHTGDLAVWDAQGNIHIVDRKKDMIISGGENISSPEIEDVLYQHPDVEECAVIGVPHEKWGETPKALVVLRRGTDASEGDLIAFCRERMANFKAPTSVEFLRELPRTATGKLQKFRLREKYWQGHDRKVG